MAEDNRPSIKDEEQYQKLREQGARPHPGRGSTGEGGQNRHDTEEDGHRPADQHPYTRHRVDGAFGYGTQAPFLVASAPRERVDAVGHADQAEEDEQDSRCRHHRR